MCIKSFKSHSGFRTHFICSNDTDDGIFFLFLRHQYHLLKYLYTIRNFVCIHRSFEKIALSFGDICQYFFKSFNFRSKCFFSKIKGLRSESKRKTTPQRDRKIINAKHFFRFLFYDLVKKGDYIIDF